MYAFSVMARGHDERAGKSGKTESSSEEADLEKLALAVYDALFHGGGVVEADGIFHPVSRTSRADVRYVEIGGFSFIEQNPQKESQWGAKAREGNKILWVKKGPRYVARVMEGRFLSLVKKKAISKRT